MTPGSRMSAKIMATSRPPISMTASRPGPCAVGRFELLAGCGTKGSSASIVEETFSCGQKIVFHGDQSYAKHSSGDFIKFIRRYFMAALVGPFGFFLLAVVRHFRSFIAACFTAT
jgi:hypothetical protein